MVVRIILSFCLLLATLQAESIRSTTGNILFDINNDGSSEAHLNSDGLAVGSALSPSTNLHVTGSTIVTGDLVIGGTAGNSTIEVQGTIGYSHQTVSSNTTLDATSIVLVDTSSDNVTVTLPYAGNVLGRQYCIKKISTANEVTVNGGGNFIDQTNDVLLNSGNVASLKVISNGTQWFISYKMSTGVGNGVTASANLICRLKFNESSGTTASDSSGQGYNGTLTNMAGTEWTTGARDNGLELDGTDDYVDLGDVTQLNSAGAFSITGWYLQDVLDVSECMWSKVNTTSALIRARTYSNGKLYTYVESSNNNGHVSFDYSTVVAAGAWHHYAWVYDGSLANADKIKVYVDGTEVATTVTGTIGSTTIDLSTKDLTVGKVTDIDDDDWNGKIDEFRVYNKALSASEVQSVYQE